MKQVTAMVKHIIKDCNQFKKSPTVEKIRKDVIVYQNKVNELGK